jgi:hypothetical protein
LNGSEGLNRIAKVIRYISYLLVAIAIFVAMDTQGSGSIFALLFFGLPALLLFAIAWIIDGFAKKR